MIATFALLAVTAEALSLALGHLNTGLGYHRVGQNDKAVREFNVILRDYADSPVADDALYWSAQAWEASGQKDRAAAILADMAKRFPNSEYLAAATEPVEDLPPARPAPVVVPATPPAPVPVVTSPKPPVQPIANLAVKKVNEQTVAILNGTTYTTAADLQAALETLKKSRPTTVVTFRRDDDVDLQMVVDAINALDKAGLTYKLP